jgi:hypothetical protein
MFSNGNSFGPDVGSSLGASVGNAVGGGEGGRWPVPAWKFGLRLSDDGI